MRVKKSNEKPQKRYRQREKAKLGMYKSFWAFVEYENPEFLERFKVKYGVETQKGDKGGMANAKMYPFLEQNITAFLGLHKLRHGLTFRIVYFLKI